MQANRRETTMAMDGVRPVPDTRKGIPSMALRDAFSRFLRGKAESQRSGGDSGDSSSSTTLDNLANDVASGDDPDLVVLVERLEGFYDPEADEFVPTDVAVEIIEGFEGDDPKVLVRSLGDAAQGSGEQGSSSGTGGDTSGSA
jgi:hypothetical protein